MDNSIARFQISADEDFRIQFVFVGLSLAGRTLRILVKERASNVIRTTLTLGAGLTLDGTDTVTALVPQATASAWAKGEFETDLHDITGGANTRLVGARTLYDLPGKLPYGVIGAKATVQWVVNKAVVTAIGGIGPTGPANTLTIGTVDTLPVGSPATAEITGTAPNQTLNLGIPTGDTGDTGPAGTIAVGTVTTGAPGSSVVVTNVGTPENAILDFTIPEGDQGIQGLTGNKGWSPAFAIVSDGARRVLQVDDWVGGEGVKPATGDYVGATGLTPTIGDAVDIRGPAGTATIPDGDKGDITTSDSGDTWLIKAGAVSDAKVATPATASDGVDSAKLAFIASGSGAAPRTVQDKLRDVVSAFDFDTVGDGVADDTAGLQAAITAAASQGKTLHLGGKGRTFKITTALALPSDSRIEGAGATIDMRSIASTPYHGLVAEGALGTTSALSANGAAGAFSVTVANGALFTAGDYVLLTSGANYSYSGYNVDKGEVKRIRSIATNTITFTTPLNDTYNTADTATLRNVDWVDNVHVRGVRLLGSNTAGRGERGICLRWVKNFSVEGCELIDQDIYQIEVTASILGRVTDNYLHGVFYDGETGTTFYGVVLNNSTTWVNVEGNHGDRNRHLVVTTAFSEGNGYYGQPMFITIAHNKMADSMAGASGRSFAFECHGFGRFIDWVGNQADGCYAGLRLENGNDQKVIGNTFRNYAYQGIIIGGNGLNNRNIIISDNIISSYTGEVTAGNPCGIALVADVSGASFVNIVVSGNVMTGLHTGGYGMGVNILPNTSTYSGIVVSGNLIDGLDADSVAVFCASGAHDVSVLNNRIIGYRGGITLNGSRCTARGNRIERTSAPASGYGIYSNGDRNVIQGNEIRFINTPIRTDTGSTKNLCLNNQFVQCTNTASNSGTDNVFRDSDVI